MLWGHGRICRGIFVIQYRTYSEQVKSVGLFTSDIQTTEEPTHYEKNWILGQSVATPGGRGSHITKWLPCHVLRYAP
jgi:hypothetical protein